MNKTVQSSKNDPKREAIASLMLGVISTIPGIALVIEIVYPGLLILPKEMILIGLSPFIGIFFGVKGLDSTRKNLAIVGIIFSIIGIISLIIILLLALWWAMTEGY